jgi:ferrous iron transport protein A
VTQIKIENLLPGDKGRISGFEKGSGIYRERLLSMGLSKGTVFTLLKIAPLGDPIEIEVAGYNLSLRKNEADILIIDKETVIT